LLLAIAGVQVADAAPQKKTPEEKQIATLKRKIKAMEKRKSNVETQIDFCKHKIELHELCRDCHTGNCKSQGITGACRHWAMEPFGKKRVRVCHQLPQGPQRYSGIDQAITSLENKIDVYENTLARVEEKIAELEDELEQARSGDFSGDSDEEDDEDSAEDAEEEEDDAFTKKRKNQSKKKKKRTSYY
jgi:chaperonin cofactor prefoldin